MNQSIGVRMPLMRPAESLSIASIQSLIRQCSRRLGNPIIFSPADAVPLIRLCKRLGASAALINECILLAGGNETFERVEEMDGQMNVKTELEVKETAFRRRRDSGSQDSSDSYSEYCLDSSQDDTDYENGPLRAWASSFIAIRNARRRRRQRMRERQRLPAKQEPYNVADYLRQIGPHLWNLQEQGASPEELGRVMTKMSPGGDLNFMGGWRVSRVPKDGGASEDQCMDQDTSDLCENDDSRYTYVVY